MRIPVIRGKIKRRLLVNYRTDPATVERLLPQPFRPTLHHGFAIVGVCLIRLEQIRPAGLPPFVGMASENAAHRIAVEWIDPGGAAREGVFIPRRDTGSFMNHLAGGRIFPGEHHRARFTVTDSRGRIEFLMESVDGSVSVKVIGQETESFPASSCFASLEEASAFFEAGSLGYSVTSERGRFDGLLLRTLDWDVRPLSVSEVSSTFFTDPQRFPEGSIQFDHALIMRDILHEWHKAEDMDYIPAGAIVREIRAE